VRLKIGYVDVLLQRARKAIRECMQRRRRMQSAIVLDSGSNSAVGIDVRPPLA